MTAREHRGVAMAAWSTMFLKRNLLNILLTKAPVTETVLKLSVPIAWLEKGNDKMSSQSSQLSQQSDSSSESLLQTVSTIVERLNSICDVDVRNCFEMFTTDVN